MQARHFPLTRAAAAALIVLATVMVSCREGEEPTAPRVQAAMGGAATTVTSVVPDHTKRGLNLDITISGSGFDQGSVVGLERDGVPASGITTNATTFVTPRKLIANITVAADADTGKYDVAVTSSGGRKGVGIELFAVLYELVDVGVIGGDPSVAVAINDLGEVVGTSCQEGPCLTHAFYWTESGGIEELGTLPGYPRSAAYDINNLGQILGDVLCWASDPGCSPEGSGEMVLWEKVGDRWTVTRLGLRALFQGLTKINNAGQFVRAGSAYALTGGLAVEEPLPPLDPPPAVTRARAINDAGVVVGQSTANDGTGTAKALAWFKDKVGTWRILPLQALPGHNIGQAVGVSEVDGMGRIRVIGNSALALSRHRGYHPVRWTLEPDGAGGWRVAAMEELPLPMKFPNAEVWGVNTAGEVVGNYFNRRIVYDAAKWPSASLLETLPSPSAGGAKATDINNSGQIVGSVYDDALGAERAAFWRLQ
jgi:probable HAF family extracellular repeat protein